MSNNTKLIVCDVDGTLLDKSEAKPSDEIIKLIDDVISSKKLFSLASGRSYNALKNLFGNSNIFYICSDGAYAVKNDKIIYKSPICSNVLKLIIAKLNSADFVLYGKDFAYASNENIEKIIYSAENGKVKPISLYNNEEIFKLAVFKDNSYASHYIKVNNLLRECYHDNEWTEYVNKNTDKGTALEFIQTKCETSYNETAVFGDGENDIPMLKKAHYSYAVKSAGYEIKSLARFYTNDIKNEIEKLIWLFLKGATF